MQVRPTDWLLLLLLGFIWGSSFILMKIGLVSFSNREVAALRMFIALLACLPMLWSHFRQMESKLWLKLAVPGLFGNGIPAFLFTAAQTELESSLVGMLNSLVPVLTLVLGVLFFQMKAGIWQVMGLLVGLVGAALLILGPDVTGGFKPEAILVVIATLCYAINVNYVRSHLAGLPSTLITAGGFVWAGVPCGLFLLTTNVANAVQVEGAWKALGAITVLAVVGTALAVVIFNRLIARTGPLFSSMVTYIVPVFAVMWGVIDNEAIRSSQLFAVLLVLAGVYLVNKKPTLVKGTFTRK